MTEGETARDAAEIVRTIARWLEIRERSGQPMATTYRQLLDDVRHSALLHRMLTGVDALGAAPPRSFGQPWYGLLESGSATGCDLKPLRDRLDAAPRVAINECPWLVVEQISGDAYIVQYQPQTPRFLATRARPPATGWVLRRLDAEPEVASTGEVDGPDDPQPPEGPLVGRSSIRGRRRRDVQVR